MRNRRHKNHQWAPVSFIYQPVLRHPTRIKNIDESTYQIILLNGATTVTQRCIECGLLSSYVVAGKAENERRTA